MLYVCDKVLRQRLPVNDTQNFKVLMLSKFFVVYILYVKNDDEVWTIKTELLSCFQHLRMTLWQHFKQYNKLHHTVFLHFHKWNSFYSTKLYVCLIFFLINFEEKSLSCLHLDMSACVVITGILSFEPAHEIMVFIIYATSEGSGEPAHLGSLARAFAVRTHEVWK